MYLSSQLLVSFFAFGISFFTFGVSFFRTEGIFDTTVDPGGGAVGVEILFVRVDVKSKKADK